MQRTILLLVVFFILLTVNLFADESVAKLEKTEPIIYVSLDTGSDYIESGCKNFMTFSYTVTATDDMDSATLAFARALAAEECMPIDLDLIKKALFCECLDEATCFWQAIKAGEKKYYSVCCVLLSRS